MKINISSCYYKVKTLNKFDIQLRKVAKQGKDIEKIIYVVEKLANDELLEIEYRDHRLINNKNYKNCRECHIEPDWLLIYKYNKKN